LAASDSLLVLEAARAINDVPIDAATPHLAKLLARQDSFSDAKVRELILLRALNAHFRLGTAESAMAVARFTADGQSPEVLRVEALRMLADWGKPATRDRVTGVYRPLPQRDEQVAMDAVRPVLPDILRTAPDRVRVAAATLVGTVGLTDPTVLVDLVRNRKFSGEARAAALAALVDQKPAQLISIVESALSDKDPAVRRAAIHAASKLPDAAARLGKLVETATGRDQQAVVAALAAMQDPAADELLTHSLDKLLTNKVQPEARLDLLTAAEARQSASPAVAERLKRYQASLPKDDPVAPFAETLAGGDAARGRKIFIERADVQCLRCHAIKGEGGAAGPDLAGIGKRQTRQYLLESILFPAKHIAEGWETVTVRVKNGDTFAGVLKGEDANHVVLLDPEKGELKIEKSQVTGRRGGQTAMPHDIAQPLSKHDVRDLVEFLASLK
jgi:quinoprotein glucose dehydrogenase